MGYLNSEMRKELLVLIQQYFTSIDVKVFYRNNFKISSFFSRKEKFDESLNSCCVYSYTCDCCQQSYVGSTSLQQFIRRSQHSGISHRTGRPYSSPTHSAIRDHCARFNHPFKLSNFSTLCKAQNEQDLRILESLFIFTNKPELNNDQSSVKLLIAPTF
jgi:hypothetical protein